MARDKRWGISFLYPKPSPNRRAPKIFYENLPLIWVIARQNMAIWPIGQPKGAATQQYVIRRSRASRQPSAYWLGNVHWCGRLRLSISTASTVSLSHGELCAEKRPFIDTSKHLIITGTHPSPLGANRVVLHSPFSKANDYLIAHGKKPDRLQLLQ